MATRDEEAAARSEILIRDAEEALAQDRMREIWNQWGSTLIGMAIMLVVGTGAGVAWREWRQGANQQSTTELMRVVNGNQYIMSDNFAGGMTKEHAAIGWLAGADKVSSEHLREFFGKAAETGDKTAWGWLGRWNSLRLRMDIPTEDPAKLLSDYESLAKDMKGKALSALAYADAAVVAGERRKDPAAALKYLAEGEKVIDRAAPMGVILGDLRHLYEIRAQSQVPDDAPQQQKPATETE